MSNTHQENPMKLGDIVQISTADGPVEAIVTRVWDRPANDPYVTVKTADDRGRTFVRCSSAVKAV